MNEYVCRILTDPVDHKMVEKLYKSYIPENGSGLPSFILGMDRLLSKYRAKYNPDNLTDDDIDNMEDESET